MPVCEIKRERLIIFLRILKIAISIIYKRGRKGPDPQIFLRAPTASVTRQVVDELFPYANSAIVVTFKTRRTYNGVGT